MVSLLEDVFTVYANLDGYVGGIVLIGEGFCSSCWVGEEVDILEWEVEVRDWQWGVGSFNAGTGVTGP